MPCLGCSIEQMNQCMWFLCMGNSTMQILKSTRGALGTIFREESMAFVLAIQCQVCSMWKSSRSQMQGRLSLCLKTDTNMSSYEQPWCGWKVAFGYPSSNCNLPSHLLRHSQAFSQLIDLYAWVPTTGPSYERVVAMKRKDDKSDEGTREKTFFLIMQDQKSYAATIM